MDLITVRTDKLIALLAGEFLVCSTSKYGTVVSGTAAPLPPLKFQVNWNFMEFHPPVLGFHEILQV